MVLASAQIFPIRQATTLRNTMLALAIPIPRQLLWAEFTRPAEITALSDTRVLRVRVAKLSRSAFSGDIPQHVSLALATATWRLRGSVSAAEDGKPHGGIEMCDVAPIGNHASKKDTGEFTA